MFSHRKIYFNKVIDKTGAPLVHFTSNRTTNDFLLECRSPKLHERWKRIARALLRRQIEFEESEDEMKECQIKVIDSPSKTTTTTSYAVRLIRFAKTFTICTRRSNGIVGVRATDKFILMPFASANTNAIQDQCASSRAARIELL